MDTPKHVDFAFPVTHGFTSTCGFAARCSTAVPVTPLQKPALIGSYGSPKVGGSSPPADLNISPSNVENVGWKALLESSKAAGPLIGTRSMDVEPDTALPDRHMEVCCTAHTTPGVRRLVKSVIRGLRAQQEPEAAVDGMGGTYFFRNESGRKVAIFKPCDEEPLAPNNPKGYVGRSLGDPGWKATVRVGEAAMREVAAYLLDHDHFARVPHTVLARANHPAFHYNRARPPQQQQSGGGVPAAAGPAAAAVPPAPAGAAGSKEVGGLSASFASTQQLAGAGGSSASTAAADDGSADEEGGLALKLGSLQEFVRHECDTTEMGCSRFSVRDVQRIAILDIRLFNTDRHAGNILVRRPTSSSLNLRGRLDDGLYELVPIDHGFCLPEALETPYFEWLHWPQAMMPLGEEELEYIASLDAAADIRLLRGELPSLRHECLRVLELSTMLLQRGAAAGLTLMEIATVMTRPLVGLGDEPSELEKLCLAARCVVDAMSAAEQLAGLGAASSSYSSGEGASLLEEVAGDVLLECSQEGQDEEEAGPSLAEVMGWSGAGAALGAAAGCRPPGGGGGGGRGFSPLGTLGGRQRSNADDMLFDIEEEGGAVCRVSEAGARPRVKPVITIGADAPISPSSMLSLDSGCSCDHLLPSPAPLLAGGAAAIAASAPARRAILLAGSALVWPPSSGSNSVGGSTLVASPSSLHVPSTPTTMRADSSSSCELSATTNCSSACSPNAKQEQQQQQQQQQQLAARLKLSHVAVGAGDAAAERQQQAPAAAAGQQAQQAQAQQQQQLTRAISLQTDGHHWSAMKAPPKPGMGKREVKSPCKKVLQAMYPPPVLSQSVPELISGIFSSFDGAAWAAFMQVLGAKMDQALAAGAWRSATNARSAAQSCPRF